MFRGGPTETERSDKYLFPNYDLFIVLSKRKKKKETLQENLLRTQKSLKVTKTEETAILEQPHQRASITWQGS